jgi:hypothetical protein
MFHAAGKEASAAKIDPRIHKDEVQFYSLGGEI